MNLPETGRWFCAGVIAGSVVWVVLLAVGYLLSLVLGFEGSRDDSD